MQLENVMGGQKSSLGLKLGSLHQGSIPISEGPRWEKGDGKGAICLLMHKPV